MVERGGNTTAASEPGAAKFGLRPRGAWNGFDLGPGAQAVVYRLPKFFE